MEKSERIVYSLRVATALYQKGFKAIRTAANIKDLSKTVWFFEATPELNAALAELISK